MLVLHAHLPPPLLHDAIRRKRAGVARTAAAHSRTDQSVTIGPNGSHRSPVKRIQATTVLSALIMIAGLQLILLP
jgi:hypothetical protein